MDRREKIEKAFRERPWMIGFINDEAFSEPERSAVRRLYQSFHAYDAIIMQVESAIALYDFCKASRVREPQRGMLEGVDADIQWKSWELIAHQHAAIEIFKFREIIRAHEELLKSCPTVAAVIDIDKFQSFRVALKDKFPNFEGLRHSVAHAGKRLWDAETIREDSHRGLHLGFGLVDGVANTTVGGAGLAGFQINAEVAEQLKRLRSDIREVFLPAGIMAEEMLDDRGYYTDQGNSPGARPDNEAR